MPIEWCGAGAGQDRARPQVGGLDGSVEEATDWPEGRKPRASAPRRSTQSLVRQRGVHSSARRAGGMLPGVAAAKPRRPPDGSPRIPAPRRARRGDTAVVKRAGAARSRCRARIVLPPRWGGCGLDHDPPGVSSASADSTARLMAGHASGMRGRLANFSIRSRPPPINGCTRDRQAARLGLDSPSATGTNSGISEF